MPHHFNDDNKEERKNKTKQMKILMTPNSKIVFKKLTTYK